MFMSDDEFATLPTPGIGFGIEPSAEEAEELAEEEVEAEEVEEEI